MAKRDKTGRFLKGSSGNPSGRAKSKALQRTDGWRSAITGIGTTTYDKRIGGEFCSDPIGYAQAREAWRGDAMAARIIETIPNEMLREGFELTTAEEGDQDGVDEVMQRWEDLNLTQTLWEALTYERAYGGGAILLGALDGAANLSEPLDEDRVREFEWLTALEPRELSPVSWYTDPTKSKFGKPEIYNLTPITIGTTLTGDSRSHVNVPVHESRLIIFGGIRVSRSLANADGWGDSVLSRVWPALRDFHMAFSAAGIMLNDFSQPVLKMKGLAEIIATDDAKLLKTRVAAIELARSVARTVLIDANEEYERKQTPVAGMPELLDRLATQLAAAADMPLTLLMGLSPAGLNATGESDIRFFYDRVSSKQDLKITPAIKRISDLIYRATGKPAPESLGVRYNPLWQPTEKETAEARKIQADTDAIYISNGVVTPEEVAVSRFSGDQYSFETVVDFKARDELEADPEPKPTPPPQFAQPAEEPPPETEPEPEGEE